jgi:hypothetical protein
MKTLVELLPLAIGLALIGALTWFLLDREIVVGRWLLAALLFSHGWVHVMFVFPQPAASTADAARWPFDMGRSWLIGGGLDPGMVRALGVALIAVVLVGSLLAALATMGWLVPAGWWGFLVVGSAAASIVLLGMFYAPMLILGFVIDIALIVFVFASAWRPSGSPLPT